MSKPTPPRHEPLADWLPDYEIGERFGAGASTVRFRAVRTSDKRQVVIKTVKPALRGGQQAAAALRREAEVCRTVRHPVVATLLEVVDDDDRVALIFDDHEGHDLVDVLDRLPRVAPESAMAIGLELANGLAAIHRGGFVHGRLRPEVVALTASGRVVLLDAGGADGRPEGDPELEAPEHMAPEQILGHTATAETDVFLLGKLLYLLFTGRAPFEGGAGGITQQIRHQAPTPITDLAPDAPRDAQRIIARCVRKRARDRYPDATSVQSELVRLLRSQTALPQDMLVSRALASAGLAEELPPPRERGVGRGVSHRPAWIDTALRFALPALAAVVLGLIAWQLVGDDPLASGRGPQGIIKRPAQIRVVAYPWAEIHIDGELVEITPVGYPIEVTPGKHRVIFKHPNAAPVTRDIEIIAGQTILLDVEMTIEQTVDAGSAADATPEDESP